MSLSTRKIHIRIVTEKDLSREVNDINEKLTLFEVQFTNLGGEKRQYLSLKGYCADSAAILEPREIPPLKAAFETFSFNMRKFDDEFLNFRAETERKLSFHSEAFQTKIRETLEVLAKGAESLFLFLNNEKSLYVEEKKLPVKKIIIPPAAPSSPESKSVRISPTSGKPE
jgi:hypothetical protein